MINNSSLVLFYNYTVPNFNIENEKLPNFIGRIGLDRETAKKMVPQIIEAAGKLDTRTVLILEDTQENLALIQNQYEKFTKEYNCYIEWHIENINLKNIPEKEGKVIKDNIEDKTKSLLLVVYSTPAFSKTGNIDIDKEAPVGIFKIDGVIDLTMLKNISDKLTEMGYPPLYWMVYPYTDSNYKYFNDKGEQITKKINYCLNCQQKNEKDLNVCRLCELTYLKDYAINLLNKGVTEIFMDSDEAEIDGDEE